ncbi:GLUG motif-containing protein, partial [Shewanella indica]|uniref:GLUG motif-containing protein n=1 Tax=Shewanella indica TaxID=768528 RepID=UPI00313B27FE
NNVGGLIGAGTSGNLTNSTAGGAVTQIGSAGNSYSYIGGLVGNNSMTIVNAKASGAVSVSAQPSTIYSVGGLVGSNTGLVQNSS